MIKKILFFFVLITSFLYTWDVNANSLYCFKNASGTDVCTRADTNQKAINQFDYIKTSDQSSYFSWYNTNSVKVDTVTTSNTFNYTNNSDSFNLYVWGGTDNSSAWWDNSQINDNWSKESTTWPELNCLGLPGCTNIDTSDTSKELKSGNIGISVIASLIGQLIQFVAVVAVIALILSGMMYLLSWWEEEKTKKAKSWIIWSLVWVFLSISAWGIINMLNKITIW